MTRATRRIGVLLLGCGRAAVIHSRTLRRLGGVDLFFASRSQARADGLSGRFGGRRSYGSYNAALADTNVAVVIVATPPALHREHTLLGLGAGKHVIVEKPAFLRAADVDDVESAAVRAGRRVFVAENYFYKPIAEYLRQLVRSGDLGEVQVVTIDARKMQRVEGWRGDPALAGGGALFEGGVHWVSFASNLGLEVESVYGYPVGSSLGAERSTLLRFRYRGGATATLVHSWELPAPLGLRLSRIQGTRGATTFESNGLFALSTGRRLAARIILRDILGYRAMFQDFLSAVATGSSSRFTLAMARQDLVLLEQAERTMGDDLTPSSAPVPPTIFGGVLPTSRSESPK